MKNSAETTTEQIAVTTLNANQIAKSDYFGYSSVMSKESSKVTNFAIVDKSETEKFATWTIEVKKGIFESYKVVYFLNEEYNHGTIGRYLQSLQKFPTNSFLHSFGNSPVLHKFDVANVFNIPLQLLNLEKCEELASLIIDFSELNTDSTNDVKNYLSSLETFGLIIDENNTFSSKIQSLTSLQKNYVYFKDKSSSMTLKREWDKETNMDIKLHLRFDSDADKKSYPFTLLDMINDCTVKLKKDAKYVTLPISERKVLTYACIEKNLQTKYKGNAIWMKLEIVSNKDENEIDIDSLF